MERSRLKSQRTSVQDDKLRKKRTRLSVDLDKYEEEKNLLNEALELFPRATATQFVIAALRPYLKEILKRHAKAASKK